MTVTARGTIKGRTIVLAEPLALPEGTEVRLQVEPVAAPETPAEGTPAEAFAALPFFGMWADRADMGDSADHVRNSVRKK